MVRHIKVVLQESSLPLTGSTCTETPCAADTSADKKKLKLSIEVQVINAGSGMFQGNPESALQLREFDCQSGEGHTRLNSRLALREDNPIVTWGSSEVPVESTIHNLSMYTTPRRSMPQIPLSPRGILQYEVCVVLVVSWCHEKRSNPKAVVPRCDSLP